jgi:hypothetical protein
MNSKSRLTSRDRPLFLYHLQQWTAASSGIVERIRYTAFSKYSRAIRYSRMDMPDRDTPANMRAGPSHGKDKVLLGCSVARGSRVLLLSDSMTVIKTHVEQALSINCTYRWQVYGCRTWTSIAEFVRGISFLTYLSQFGTVGSP